MEFVWFALSKLEWIWSSAEKLGGLGQLAAAFLAGYALSYAKRQISASTRSQREATLRQLNVDQNRLSFENPQFTWPELLTNVDHAPGTIDGKAIEYKRYHQFVIIGLVVCERATVDGQPKEWSYSIDEFLRTHRAFLAAQPQKFFWADYDDRLIARWKNIQTEPIITGTVSQPAPGAN